jgi:hypothetical protein
MRHLSRYCVACLFALSTFGATTAIASDATAALTLNGFARIETGVQGSIIWLTPAQANRRLGISKR